MRINVTQQADELLRWLGDSATRTFLPGLSDTEIDRELSGTPFKPGSELRELYRWRNGQMIDDARHLRLPFEIYAFLPLRVATERARNLAEGGPDWKESWLPFLSNEAGDYYFCDCATPALSLQVFRYSVYSEEDDRSSLAYPDIGELLIAIREMG